MGRQGLTEADKGTAETLANMEQIGLEKKFL